MDHSKQGLPSPHQGQPILLSGAPLDQASAAMILIHGRGASAEDIISLSGEFHHPDFTYLAPQASGNTWYPQSFLAPIPDNEPWLSSALGVIDGILAQLEGSAIPPERTIVLGFSQGACLGMEYAARNARRYGGLVGLSGGLIGPPGTPRDYTGSFMRTPVFLGCSDVDPHIPASRVHETAEVLTRLGGQVTTRLYPGMGHTVNPDEIRFIQKLMSGLLEADPG